ncbi:MAG: TetR/AcrR family transcriptional regulator [Myxococcota bacterium]
MAASSSSRVTLPATARGQRTRTRLLEAAEQIFGEQGFERASIVDITRAARVAQGTFYVYFESKRVIFTELVETLGRTLRRRLAEAVEGIEGRVERDRAGFSAFLVYVAEHQHLYRIVRQAEFVDEALYRDYYRRLAEGYVRALQPDIEAGRVDDLDPEAIAYAMMGIFDFLGMRWALWEGRMPPEHVLDDVFRFLGKGLAR